MTDVLVETTKADVTVVSPTAATVNAVTATDTVLINPPDMHYISAFDTTSQTAAVASQAYKIDLNSSFIDYGITRSDGTFTFTRSGTYAIGYSIQWYNTATSIVETNVFVKKNNQIVSESSSYQSVPSSHGGIPGAAITAVNYISRFIANDTLQFWWQSNNANCKIHTIDVHVNPEMPRSPGVIVTIAQIS